MSIKNIEKEMLFTALGNRTRLKILNVLIRQKNEELTVYRISKLSGVKTDAIRKNLPILNTLGLVTEKRYGTAILYLINRDNKISKLLIDFFLKI